jgi:hypothetical protein
MKRALCNNLLVSFSDTYVSMFILALELLKTVFMWVYRQTQHVNILS